MTTGVFVTGANTDVGKTYVAALLAQDLFRRGYRVGVYKPVASGCQRTLDGYASRDADMLWEAAGRPGQGVKVCPQRFLAPLAPHLAARLEGAVVDRELLRQGVEYWRERSDVVIVEGAGGLLSPHSDEDDAADLARDFGYPLIVVTRNQLGVLNHARMTIECARSRGLSVVAGILNEVDPPGDGDVSRDSNLGELRRLCPDVPWFQLPFDATAWPEAADGPKLLQLPPLSPTSPVSPDDATIDPAD